VSEDPLPSSRFVYLFIICYYFVPVTLGLYFNSK
jgi:hypothetical protein